MSLEALANFWVILPLGLSIIALFLAKKAPQKSGWSALCGALMIIFSAWCIGVLTGVEHFFEAIKDHPSVVETDRANALSTIQIWTLVIPAAIASVGANLISSWIEG